MLNFSLPTGFRFYYQHYNRNVGRIKSIEGDKLIVNVNVGHGGGPIELPIDACHKFVPEVDDRVVLCIDKEGISRLQKLSKNRTD